MVTRKKTAHQLCALRLLQSIVHEEQVMRRKVKSSWPSTNSTSSSLLPTSWKKRSVSQGLKKTQNQVSLTHRPSVR